MVRPAFANRRVAVPRHDDVRLHRHGTGNSGIEVVDLEPE